MRSRPRNEAGLRPDRSSILRCREVAAPKRRAIECRQTQVRHVDLLRVTFGPNPCRLLVFARGKGCGEAIVRLR